MRAGATLAGGAGVERGPGHRHDGVGGGLLRGPMLARRVRPTERGGRRHEVLAVETGDPRVELGHAVLGLHDRAPPSGVPAVLGPHGRVVVELGEHASAGAPEGPDVLLCRGGEQRLLRVHGVRVVEVAQGVGEQLGVAGRQRARVEGTVGFGGPGELAAELLGALGLARCPTQRILQLVARRLHGSTPGTRVRRPLPRRGQASALGERAGEAASASVQPAAQFLHHLELVADRGLVELVHVG
jgi:hypothetical protein